MDPSFLELFKVDKLIAINEFCKRYDLDPGRDCSVTLRSSYWSSNPQHPNYTVEISINNLAKMEPHRRQQLKKDFKLEVPSWAIGSESPPLNCVTSYEGEDLILTLDLNVIGAFVCVEHGEEEVDPPEYRTREADKFENMTAEQALEYVRAEALEKRKPITRKTFSCRPV